MTDSDRREGNTRQGEVCFDELYSDQNQMYADISYWSTMSNFADNDTTPRIFLAEVASAVTKQTR